MKRIAMTASLALLTGATALTAYSPQASAQEIQLTGPLAGAPAVRGLRLHREGRFDLAVHGTFTLLDEYRRGIMPGIRANYHFYDWLGVGIFGGPVFSYNTNLSDELQEKAVNDRHCDANPNSLACRRSAVSLCREGENCLADNQLGSLVWYVAPQITVVPFRGKFSLFGELFMDADISIFAGPAIVGINERADCGEEGNLCTGNFELEHKVRVGPTFGLGFNFYPHEFVGFGAEFRATPFVQNTSGFDVACEESDDPALRCPNGDSPDDKVDGQDRSLHMNPMLTVYVSFQLPTAMTISD